MTSVVRATKFPAPTMEKIYQKLLWCSENTHFGVELTPLECDLLLDVLSESPNILKKGGGDPEMATMTKAPVEKKTTKKGGVKK